MLTKGEMSFKGFTRGSFAHAQFVNRDGYRWISGSSDKWHHPAADPSFPKDEATVPGSGPLLIDLPPVWLPREVRATSSFKRDRVNAGLHRLFAGLDPTEKEVLRFARKWGQLGRRSGIALGSLGYAESLAYWQREIQTMARLLALWELVQAEDAKALGSYVRWSRGPRQVRIYLATRDKELYPEGARRLAEKLKMTCPTDRDDPEHPSPVYLPDGAAEILACEEQEHPYRPELLADWTEGNSVAPARHYLQLEVNRHLAGHVSPVVARPELKGSSELWFVPDTLLASLYVLFALDLTEQLLPPEMCRATDCLRPFVPTTARQHYCSSTCRIRADAQRRRRQLREERNQAAGEGL